MEFRGVYLLWFLLPFMYGCLTLWVFLRPFFKQAGKEKLVTYSSSFVYTAICFVVAIALDQFGIINPVANFLGGQGFDTEDSKVTILRFVIYPFVLVSAAKLQELFRKEKAQRKNVLPKSKWDM